MRRAGQTVAGTGDSPGSCFAPWSSRARRTNCVLHSDDRAARCFDLTGLAPAMGGGAAVGVTDDRGERERQSFGRRHVADDAGGRARAARRVLLAVGLHVFPAAADAGRGDHVSRRDRRSFPELTLPSRRARLFWRVKVRMALAQSRIVLTVSDYAAAQVSKTLGVDRGRIRVAVEAAAAVYRPSESAADIVKAAARRAGVPDGRRWFTYVGGFNPHKHVDAIVRAHAALVRDVADPPMLVLVGALDDDTFFGSQQRIRDEIARCGTADHVRWAGFVPDDELRHLLSGAWPSSCRRNRRASACLRSRRPHAAFPSSPRARVRCRSCSMAAASSSRRGDEHGVRRRHAAAATDEPHRARSPPRRAAVPRTLSWTSSARSALGALTEAAA